MDLLRRNPENITLSLGKRLMVFSGLRTRSTRRDLMVLMSRPLLVLQGTSPQAATGQGEIKVTLTLLHQQGKGREAGKRPETGLEQIPSGRPQKTCFGDFTRRSPVCTHGHTCTRVNVHYFLTASGNAADYHTGKRNKGDN